jgi:hypothetical protein
MNLTLFFRLILMSIFQSMICYDKKDHRGNKMSYDGQLFYCPKVYAKDGFNVSLQIHNGNYCSSNEGYRSFGHTMKEVEFGFPSMNEEMMLEYSEGWGYGGYDDDSNELPFDKSKFDVTGTVGRIPISVMEEVFVKHGGIDWEATISIDGFNQLTKEK